MKCLSLILITVFAFSTCKNKKLPPETSLKIVPDFTTWAIPDSYRVLLPILDSVWYRDQLYRHELNKGDKEEQNIRRKIFNQRSKIVDSLEKINLTIIDSIVKKYGWLGPNQVGIRGSHAMSLTIQHADLATQEKYLPILKQAVLDQKMLPSSYAMLVDRVESDNYRPQVYGTQLVRLDGSLEVFPVLNPDSLDIWRKSMNLVPMEKYLQIWNTPWNLEEYKKKLPELKTKCKVLQDSLRH
jgi:hypothetical protein